MGSVFRAADLSSLPRSFVVPGQPGHRLALAPAVSPVIEHAVEMGVRGWLRRSLPRFYRVPCCKIRADFGRSPNTIRIALCDDPVAGRW